MATTVSVIARTVVGDHRKVVHRVTCGANSATADVPTGFYQVKWAMAQPLDGGLMPNVTPNSTSAGVATAGTVGLTSASSGKAYLVESYEGSENG